MGGTKATALNVAEGRMEGPLTLRACFRIDRVKTESKTVPFTHPCMTEGKRKLFNIWLSQIKPTINTTDNEISGSHEMKSQRVTGFL